MSAITGIHHVQITIPHHAVDAARSFYCGVLGLSEIEKPAALQSRGGFWLQVGDRQLHLGIESTAETRTATKAHVAYQVADLDGWRRRLAVEGVQVDESIPIPGFRRLEFRDPWGNRVEFIEALAGAIDPD